MICPKCGFNNEESARFCLKCGNQFISSQNSNQMGNINNINTNMQASNNVSNGNKNGNKNKLLFIILGIILLLGISAFCYFKFVYSANNDNSNGSKPTETSKPNKIPEQNDDSFVDLNTNTPGDLENGPFLMSVEDVVFVAGVGTFVYGPILRGQIKLIEQVEIVGINETLTSVVTGIKLFGEEVTSAKRGDTVSLLLRGIYEEQVTRGQVISKVQSITAHNKFDANVQIFSEKQCGKFVQISNGYQPKFYFRNADTVGTVTLPEGVQLVNSGNKTDLTVELTTNFALEIGTEFLIKDERGKAIGKGIVTKLY